MGMHGRGVADYRRKFTCVVLKEYCENRVLNLVSKIDVFELGRFYFLKERAGLE